MEKNKIFKTPEKLLEIDQIKINPFNNQISTMKLLKEITKFLFKYINDILSSNISQEKKEKIDLYFNKILSLIKKLSSEKKKIISKYDSILKLSEEKIRALYSTLFNMKIKITFLENNIDILLRKEKEYRLIKEKTGIIVENGVIIHNDRKENEIFILRTENSNLKNVIKNKEENIKALNDKYKKENSLYSKKLEELNYKIEQLKHKIKIKNNKIKGHSCSCVNLNSLDANDANISNNNNVNNNNINKNIKINNYNPIKRKCNSNLLNNNKYISLIHCQSMGHLNLNVLNNKNKIKYKSKNKTNNNLSKNNIENNNLILNNLDISPIHNRKKLYFTPHNNEINSKNNSKIKKDKNSIKVIYNSKTKFMNKNTEKEKIQKKLIKELAWSQNVSLNNSGIPKSMKKINKSKKNVKGNNIKQLYNENKNKKKGLLIMNISGKENIPINKTCLSSRIKNTINTSNNSFFK